MPVARLGRRGACRRGSARWCSRRSALFMGYLLPGENVMQVLGPGDGAPGLRSADVFIPIDDRPR